MTKAGTLSILCCAFLLNLVNAQDSIVFTSRVSPGKEYKIPLTRFDVRVKTKSNANFKALISNYSDTSIVFRILENTRISRIASRHVSRKFWKQTHNHYFSGHAYDSLQRMASEQIAAIMYPHETVIRVSEITEININNYDRPEKDKRTRRLDYSGTMGVFAAIYSARAKSLPIAEALYSMTLGFSVEAVVVEKEKLDLVNQWSLKKSESAETAIK
jgi:hypothetical protein